MDDGRNNNFTQVSSTNSTTSSSSQVQFFNLLNQQPVQPLNLHTNSLGVLTPGQLLQFFQALSQAPTLQTINLNPYPPQHGPKPD